MSGAVRRQREEWEQRLGPLRPMTRWERFQDSAFAEWFTLIVGGLLFLFFAVNALWLGLGYFCYAGAC